MCSAPCIGQDGPAPDASGDLCGLVGQDPVASRGHVWAELVSWESLGIGCSTPARARTFVDLLSRGHSSTDAAWAWACAVACH